MTFLGSASTAATFGDYTDIANLHGATKASVDAATAKLEQIRVSLTAPVLATGASSSTLQTTGNTSLASIDTKVTGLATAAAQTAGNTKLDSVITLLSDTTTPAPITATALPLPTGAATAAAQATLNASVSAPGTTATTAQGVQGVTGGLPIDTVVKSTATNRSMIVGWAGTAAAATTASTTLTVTCNYGTPTVGDVIGGTGITAGTTITAVTGTAPNFTLTLSAAATVANAASVFSSFAVRQLMAANTSRRFMSVQPQNTSTTADVYINGVATATADQSSLLIPSRTYYETSPIHIGTGAISIATASAGGVSVYAREA